MHQHQEKAGAGRIHVCLFLVCSAVVFLNHHNRAASEQQAEKPPCLPLAGRAVAVGLSCLIVACHSLEGLYVPRATRMSPCIGCAHLLCTPVILCAEQLLALTPPSLSPRDVPAGFHVRSLFPAECSTSPCRQPAATGNVTSGSVMLTRRPCGVAHGEVVCSLLSACM